MNTIVVGGYLINIDPIEKIVENSYCNFHAKGLDYLCLKRTPHLTFKAYFYNKNDSCSEVVCPHDHRYPFATTILAGKSSHYRYAPSFPSGDKAEVYQQFEWFTPLNGGKGFEHKKEVRLGKYSTERYTKGGSYWCESSEVHTIGIEEEGTVLLLLQLGDVVMPEKPTSTFVKGSSKLPPSLDGLYDSMKSDYAINLIKQLESMK